MSENPPPAEPQDAPGGAAARSESQPPAPERYGIVLVERLVKDDGRSLLLYTREGANAR